MAERTIGIAGRILPSPIAAMPLAKGLAEQRGALESELYTWIGESQSGRALDACSVAAAGGLLSGFLALVRTMQGAILVADVGTGVEMSTPAIAQAIAACGEPETPVDASRAALALDQLSRWLAARRGSATVNLSAAGAARSRRAALTRVARALARAPRHQRSTIAPLAHAARAVASAPLAEGAERILETLVQADLPDIAWLRSIAAFGELNARPAPPGDDGARLAGIILFG